MAVTETASETAVPIPHWLPVLLGLLPALATAGEPVWREPLWLQPPGADAPFPVLLTVPLGWQPGDAAVVVIPDPEGTAGPRHRAVEALLAAEAAVVELDTIAAWVAVPGLPPSPALTAAGLPTALHAALDRLRVETRAGLLVVLGFGMAGEVALAAVDAPSLGVPHPDGPRLVAAIALGAVPRFRAGPPPPPGEQWPLRAGLLCGVLAQVAGAAALQRDCRTALLP
jgi:hypothetical protein